MELPNIRRRREYTDKHINDKFKALTDEIKSQREILTAEIDRISNEFINT